MQDFGNLEKYSRGWRGAPAKGVGRATGARVQISPAPPLWIKSLVKQGFYFDLIFKYVIILLRLGDNYV